MTTHFISNASQRQRLHVAIDKMEMPFKATLGKGGKRSLEQNAYLWGVCYETILDHELREQGWTAQDLHEFFLGEFHGWQEIKGFGRRRVRPVQRSSGKSVSEFMEFIAFIQRFAAERGIYIPDPEQT